VRPFATAMVGSAPFESNSRMMSTPSPSDAA
jgi:hypothetical protein